LFEAEIKRKSHHCDHNFISLLNDEKSVKDINVECNNALKFFFYIKVTMIFSNF
jgi:hypothetical protein